MRNACIGLLFLALGVTAGRARSGESFYGRGDMIDLTLEEREDGSVEFGFSLFGSPEEGITGYESGEAAPTEKGHYQGKIDEENIAFAISTEPEFIVVKSPILKRAGGSVDLSGTYRGIAGEERTRRAKRRFDAADELLNTVYATTKAELGMEGVKILREKQREWIEYRDSMAEHAVRGDQEGKNYAFWDEAMNLTATRIQFLKIYSGARISPGLSGDYTDGFGGHMVVKQTTSGIHFSIEVVRGPTSHTGEIEDDAHKTKTGFFFRDQPETGEDRKPATLTFIPLDAHIIEVKGENTGYYHGARASFDGTYFKESPRR